MDFGDHEHIFSPPRRWLKRQQEAFFSLTPAEKALVEQSAANTEDAASTKGSS
ncbi:hypothetical protein QCA50_006671 [Cerrena zonata]|uniref:Uncharacterized protein n=1 Tax=Cerrena zonata TaxID=2478898 RepID=A0AAW0GJI0_9APHY